MNEISEYWKTKEDKKLPNKENAWLKTFSQKAHISIKIRIKNVKTGNVRQKYCFWEAFS